MDVLVTVHIRSLESPTSEDPAFQLFTTCHPVIVLAKLKLERSNSICIQSHDLALNWSGG